MPHQSQVDVWSELFSDEPTEALARLGSPQRDELEPLDSVTGHWTSDPAGTRSTSRASRPAPVDDLVKAMGTSGVSKSEVSLLCEEIDGRVKTFLERPIEGDRP